MGRPYSDTLSYGNAIGLAAVGFGNWELTELQFSRDAACFDQPHRRRAALPQQRLRICRPRRPPARPSDGRRGEDAAQSDRAPVRAGRHGHRDPRRAWRQRRDVLPLGAGRRSAVAGSIRPWACWSTFTTRSSSTRCCAGAPIRRSRTLPAPPRRRRRWARTPSPRPAPAATRSR